MSSITIKDIAKKTGYSTATVSRVLADNGYPVDAKTKAVIQECADSLGYVPNLLARSLKTNSSKEIAVITPSFHNPFYASVMSGIESTISKHGYSLLVYYYKRNSGKPKALIDSILSKKVAGVIIASDCVGTDLAFSLRDLKKRGVPVIVYVSEVDGFPDLLGVFFDHRRGGRLVAQTLYENGHKQVALISLDYSNQTTRRTFVGGFCDYYREIGYPLRENQDIFQSPEKDDFIAGAELCEKVLSSSKKYTAIAANNDSVAAGALSVLIQKGISVPDEISIIGMDDSIYSRMTTPLLSTLQIPSQDMGNLAAKLLLEEIDGNPMKYSIILQSGIVERQTLKDISKKGKDEKTLHLHVLKSKEELGEKAAALIALKINEAIAAKGEARIVLSTGASQFETLAALNKLDVDWSKVTMFHLSEYVDLPLSHFASFRKYLTERFVDIVHPKEACFVNGEGNIEENIAYLTGRLTEKPIDVGVIGIGENAHIAFNDPPADLETKESFIIVNLNDRCKKQQVGEGWFPTTDDVPKQAISMTPFRIMQCKCIVSPVPKAVKAEAIAAVLRSKSVDPMVPGTLLKTHPDFHLFTDRDSISFCSKTDVEQYLEKTED